MKESALTLGELASAQQRLGVRALSQGFAGGLAALSGHYGAEIADTRLASEITSLTKR